MAPAYLIHLIKDPKLLGAIDQEKVFKLVQREKIYLYLCKSIMSQQLSTKVANVIYNRFLDLFGGKEPEPAEIIATPFDTLRAIGLSNAKTRYIQNVALFAIEQGMVEMLLMFTMGREDVFAVDDLGIQNAMIGIYKIRHRDKTKMKKRMIDISQKWKPYRTYACLHLWHWQNNIVR